MVNWREVDRIYSMGAILEMERTSKYKHNHQDQTNAHWHSLGHSKTTRQCAKERMRIWEGIRSILFTVLIGCSRSVYGEAAARCSGGLS